MHSIRLLSKYTTSFLSDERDGKMTTVILAANQSNALEIARLIAPRHLDLKPCKQGLAVFSAINGSFPAPEASAPRGDVVSNFPERPKSTTIDDF